MLSEKEKERIKMSVPIPEILSRLGFRTDHRGYMYYSPFRDEAEPSMSYDARRNLWCDHGTGEGGDSIRLVMLLCGLPFVEAVEWLKNTSGEVVSWSEDHANDHRVNRQKGLEVLRVSDNFTSPELISYAEGRGVGVSLLQKYCKEVTYRNRSNGKSYIAIGFPNNEGGYVLRSGGFKGNTGSTITTIGINGKLGSAPTSDVVLIFEGFFNFLSYLVLKGVDTACCDVVVLNSVNNTRKAVEYISRHRYAEAYVDNDAAGRKCLEQVRDCCNGTHVMDFSITYAHDNDVNEHLAGLQRRDVTVAKDVSCGLKP